MPYNKSKLLHYSFPFASLVPYTQAVGWAQYGVGSVLRQSWVTQAMLYTLSRQGIFPLTSMLWVTLMDECFFCSNWHNIDNPGKQQTCWELCGDLEPWEESGWSFILLHVAWLTLITAFFSLLFNQKFLFSSPLPTSANTLSHLVFPPPSTRENLGTHILDSFGHYRSKEEKKGHTRVLSLALQFWPASKARHVCPLIIHLGNCKLWANSLTLPAPLAAHLAAAGGCGTLKHLSAEVHNQPE